LISVNSLKPRPCLWTLLGRINFFNLLYDKKYKTNL
jgi:hypothetical protein